MLSSTITSGGARHVVLACICVRGTYTPYSHVNEQHRSGAIITSLNSASHVSGHKFCSRKKVIIERLVQEQLVQEEMVEISYIEHIEQLVQEEMVEIS